MSSRSRRTVLAAFAVVGLLVTACDSGRSDGTGPDSTGQPGSSAPVDGEVLAYQFAAGDTLTYAVELEQHIILESDGTPGVLADEGAPGNADVTVTGSGTFTYQVAAGPDPDTYSVTIDGQFDETAVDGTADGEPVDDMADIADLGVAQPVSTVVVVDAQGRIVEEPGAANPLGLGATPLAGLTGDLGRLPGPVLSTEPVAPGSTWSETTTDAALGDEPVETVATSTVTGLEALDGADTLTIETKAETGAAEIDLSAFFAEFMGSFDDTDTIPAGGDVVFRITIEPSSTEATTWFDPTLGQARRHVAAGPPTNFVMEVALPDEDTGELQDYTMRLSVTQSLDYTLVPNGG